MIPEVLNDTTNELTEMARDAIAELWDLLCDLDRRITSFDKRIAAVFKASPTCQRIAKIKGVGPKTATAIVAAIGDGNEFRNGRHLAAWLGLVPRLYSSGDKRTMLSIAKRGSKHLSTLLVHGARAVVRTAPNKTDPLNTWVNDLRERRGYNRATVAVANNEPLCGRKWSAPLVRMPTCDGSSTMAIARFGISLGRIAFDVSLWAVLRSGELYRAAA